MNGRFSRLEFGERRARGPGAAPTGSAGQAIRVQAPLQEAIGTPIQTPALCVRQAVEAYQSGRFEPALQMYTRALQGDRGLVAAWVGQVQMLVELGEYPEARLWSDKALELLRSNGDLLAVKAQACLRQRDAKGAAASSDLSLASPGSSALRWRVRGEVLLRKSADRARDCFEKSLAEPGADWFDRILVARVYLFHGQPTPALAHAQPAAESLVSNSYAWRIVGDCQDAMGWTDRAYTSYHRALQLPGDHDQTRAALRTLQGRSGAARLRRWLGGFFRR
jgi:tetratricopeptide (TPR) repeat protein